MIANWGAIAGAIAMGSAIYLLLPPAPITRIDVPRKRWLPQLRNRSSELDRHSAVIPAVAAGVMVVLALGGSFGVAMAAVVGAIAGVVVFRAMRGRRVNTVSLRDQPALVDLLAATLSAGAVPLDALHWVGRSWPGPLGDDLVRVATAIRWGASMDEAWTHVEHPQVWQLVRDAFTRSARTGAPVVSILESTARELRREHRERVEVAAHSAGVRVVLPLALCFLPAYLLWGIVPIVMSWGTSILP